MRIPSLFAVVSFVTYSLAQSSGTITSISATVTRAEYATGNVTYNTNNSPSPLNTVFTYTVGGSTRTRTESVVATSATSLGNSTATFNRTVTAASTILSGSIRPSSTAVNGTATRSSSTTSSAATPVNTVPCNGYPELCNRKYSNITHVAAHNSPFTQRNNVAANQMLDVTTQLNDGVRMLQFQVHKPNNTLYLCHTSCDLLNAGELTTYLRTVKTWLDNNRYDVITIVMGNYQVLKPSEFVQPVVDSGLIDYAYIPPTVPMNIDGWPTLGEMILTNARAVIMLDYEADQAQIPWLLDEFSYMWETPFSPTDRDFPCTADRPPNQERSVYEQRLSLANHNLNIDIAIAGISILAPASNILNETNADNGYGSAGWAVTNCTRDWQRPPNFLLVDFYNIGNFNGSVFAVAAKANNVTYNRNSCCGVVTRNSGARLGMPQGMVLSLVAALSAAIMMI